MNAVIDTQAAATGELTATVRYEDGTNDGLYQVRYNGRAVTSVSMVSRLNAGVERKLDRPIRVTKAAAVGVYYGVVGVFYEWQEERDRAVEAEPMSVVASVGLSVGFKANLTGGWEEDTIRAILAEKLEKALTAIETMVPEGAADGTGGTFLLTDVWWNNVSGWDVEKA